MEHKDLTVNQNIETDWSLRSKMYDNIQWVNKNDTLQVMLEFSEIINNSTTRILDIGVGTGKVLKYFKQAQPNIECYGIDISTDMMDKIDNIYNFNLNVANAENLSCFEDNSFDLVTARMSMHHVENIQVALKEIHRVLKNNCNFIICEGVVPSRETFDFYTEMFKYKEKRSSFLVDDLINLMCNASYDKVTSRTIIQENMSMNNWLVNSGISDENKEIIRKLHYNCSDTVKKAYKMDFVNDDILMEWKFAVVKGTKMVG